MGRGTTGFRFGVPADAGAARWRWPRTSERRARFEPGPDSTGSLAEGSSTSTSRVIDADAPQPAVSLWAGILP